MAIQQQKSLLNCLHCPVSKYDYEPGLHDLCRRDGTKNGHRRQVCPWYKCRNYIQIGVLLSVAVLIGAQWCSVMTGLTYIHCHSVWGSFVHWGSYARLCMPWSSFRFTIYNCLWRSHIDPNTKPEHLFKPCSVFWHCVVCSRDLVFKKDQLRN